MKKQESFYWNNMKITPQEQSYIQKYMPNLQSKCLTLRIFKNSKEWNKIEFNSHQNRWQKIRICQIFEWSANHVVFWVCTMLWSGETLPKYIPGYVLLRYMYIPNLQTYIPEILKEFKVLKLHLILSTCTLMVFV